MHPTITSKLIDLCSRSGLAYSGEPPTEVAPGVHTFYATMLNEDCTKHGYCRQKKYCVIEYGEQLFLEETYERKGSI